MRPVLFVLLFLVSLSACDSSEIQPVAVQWMDWSWQVRGGEPFRTRVVVWGVCGQNPRFRAGATADQSTVKFEPYFIVERDRNTVCPASAEILIVVDTAGMAPGLRAGTTYEMRGAVDGITVEPLGEPGFPTRPFGQVSVALPSELILGGRRNAAGYVYKQNGSDGCVRIFPGGLAAGVVLENPVDTAGLFNAFVRGYIHQPAAPLCGETTVFHLESRN